MNDDTVSDEVIDDIASIELHRQGLEKESGPDAAREFALRRLQELLEREQQSSAPNGSGPGNLANIRALTAEFKRVKSLSGARTQHQRPALESKPPRPHQPGRRSWQGAQPTSSRNRGRRPQGRRSGR